MAAYFVIGNIYNVWETKGLTNKNGHLTVSEKVTAPDSVINPSMDAKYLGKDQPGLEGYHAFSLDDGTVFTAHRNHFDVTTEYCQSKIRNREQKALKQQEKERAAALKAEADTKNNSATGASQAAETTDDVEAIRQMLQESGAAEELIDTQGQTASSEVTEDEFGGSLLDSVLEEVREEAEVSSVEVLEASNG